MTSSILRVHTAKLNQEISFDYLFDLYNWHSWSYSSSDIFAIRLQWIRKVSVQQKFETIDGDHMTRYFRREQLVLIVYYLLNVSFKKLKTIAAKMFTRMLVCCAITRHPNMPRYESNLFQTLRVLIPLCTRLLDTVVYSVNWLLTFTRTWWTTQTRIPAYGDQSLEFAM